MDHPLPGLRFVSAKDLDDSGQKLAGLPVNSADGQKVGEIEGFIIDVAEGRPRHIAVAAGWFIHKHFLLPVGHARLNGDATALVTDITKDRIERFPGFDKREFDKITSDDRQRLDQTMAAACVDGDVLSMGTLDSHDRSPDWWQSTFYRVPATERR